MEKRILSDAQIKILTDYAYTATGAHRLDSKFDFREIPGQYEKIEFEGPAPKGTDWLHDHKKALSSIAEILRISGVLEIPTVQHNDNLEPVYYKLQAAGIKNTILNMTPGSPCTIVIPVNSPDNYDKVAKLILLSHSEQKATQMKELPPEDRKLFHAQWKEDTVGMSKTLGIDVPKSVNEIIKAAENSIPKERVAGG